MGVVELQAVRKAKTRLPAAAKPICTVWGSPKQQFEECHAMPVVLTNYGCWKKTPRTSRSEVAEAPPKSWRIQALPEGGGLARARERLDPCSFGRKELPEAAFKSRIQFSLAWILGGRGEATALAARRPLHCAMRASCGCGGQSLSCCKSSWMKPWFGSRSVGYSQVATGANRASRLCKDMVGRKLYVTYSPNCRQFPSEGLRAAVELALWGRSGAGVPDRLR